MTPESPMSESAPLPGHFKDEKRLKVLDEGIVFGADAQEGNVTVENVSAETLMFKVKTTNPDKFRVSPPAGIIRAKQRECITVTMVHGHRVEDTSARDKFLIMCKPLDEETNDDFVPIEKIHRDFKQASNADIEHHRIRCIYPGSGNGTSDICHPGDGKGVAVRASSLRMRLNSEGEDRFSGSHQFPMVDLQETVVRLERKVSRIQTLLFILLAIIFLMLAMVFVYMPKLGAESLASICSCSKGNENTLEGAASDV